MAVKDLGGGRLRITVVGDILIVDAARFASLVRTVDKAPGNIAEVVFDARVVRILEPISLQSGMIRIYADQVSFENRGLIALTKPAATADGLEVNAIQLDLRKSLALPLQVSVNPNRARRVTVRAQQLLTTAGILQGVAASRSLWRHSSNFDGAFPASLPAEWNVTVSDDGANAAVEAMKGVVAWPAYTAYKLRKHHALTPFDEGRKTTLAERIRAVRPLVETLERAEVLMDMDALELLMRRNVDQRGRGPAHVPSKDMLSAMDRFKLSRESASGQLSKLKTLIMSAHSAPVLDTYALNAATSRIRFLGEAQNLRRAEMSTVFTDIASALARAEQIDAAVAYEREYSRKELERRTGRDGDLRNIRIGTTVLAVGASFIGTPAAGAAIAAGVGVAGDIVYANNAGQPLNVETLATIAAKNAQMYQKLHSARQAWEKHTADLRDAEQVFTGKQVVPEGAKKPLTRTEAAKRAGQSAGDFASKVKAVHDGMGAIPKPDNLTLNDIEKNNGALQRQLARLADVQRELSDLTAKLDGLHNTIAADEAELAETRLVEQVLLELKPSNDQELVRWKTAALQLWARELQALYYDAMDLRRSLFFETWKTPSLPPEILTYPEEFTAYLAAGRYSPDSPGATTPVALTAAHLDNEIAKHMAVLDGIARSIDQAWQLYQAERASGAQPFFDQQQIANGRSAPPNVRLFMEQLNAQIRRQIESPEAREQQQFTLLIPFDMTRPPAPLPERLLRVGIVDPRVRNEAALAGKTLFFDVTYRTAGELRRNAECAYVDLSVPNGEKTAVIRSSNKEPASVSQRRAEAETPLTFESLRQSRAAPPARTLYFLSVTVGGSPQDANWKSVPVIDGFTFWRRIVQ
ncbi:hypothetical protein HHL21_06325 [Massilia sp. RP-1-19]|uniref:Tc toxin complex TcA C-terminal TcB-binding domain-containing protein n=1 Tax=Massilia polaris TaxID=2728846 RepID=A0A848HI24_9BURK|nr:hypothetical protein [Massilia polaris]NML60707.1 hypothetical protein [Massilia polaris]